MGAPNGELTSLAPHRYPVEASLDFSDTSGLIHPQAGYRTMSTKTKALLTIIPLKRPTPPSRIMARDSSDRRSSCPSSIRPSSLPSAVKGSAHSSFSILPSSGGKHPKRLTRHSDSAVTFDYNPLHTLGGVAISSPNQWKRKHVGEWDMSMQDHVLMGEQWTFN